MVDDVNDNDNDDDDDENDEVSGVMVVGGIISQRTNDRVSGRRATIFQRS